jgi:U32 family peptidase
MTVAPSPRQAILHRPELIAPAGDWSCAKAAVENGADGVYFGLQGGFNARARATNFSAEQLPELMFYLHQRGVKGYVTLNTLVFSDELAAFESTVRSVVAAGIDAVMVQDLGAARLIRAVCPTCPIHASTQMTLTSAAGIAQIESLGFERVVLARELSLAQIAQIRRQTSIGLEVFVHGALCISYSGQCLASQTLGGRSANRGQCAQPCRLPYELICDGRPVDLGEKKYLLSPCDLAAYDLLPELIAAGVDALKLEGRLKTAEYVAAVTRCYRRAIDAAIDGHCAPQTPDEIEELEVSFSRGFSHGWLEGVDKALVPGTSSAKRGVAIGEVRAVRGSRVAVELAGAVKRGDGVVFVADRSQASEQGGRIYEVFRGGQSLREVVSQGLVELTFGRGAIDLSQLKPGQQVRKTDDPQLDRRMQKTYCGASQRQVPLDVSVTATVGRPLQIVVRAGTGAQCRLESVEGLAPAVKHPLTAEVLRQQLGRLGQTVYQLRELKVRIEGSPMVPLSVLGQMRHEMVRQLDAAIALMPPRPTNSPSALAALRATIRAEEDRPIVVGQELGQSPADAAHPPVAPLPPQLHVLCRRPQQVPAVVGCGVSSVILDFSDPREYEPAVRIAHGVGVKAMLTTPRLDSGDAAVLQAKVPSSLVPFPEREREVEEGMADGFLVRNLAGLGSFRGRGLPLVADFSLNATNELTVQWLCQQGATRVTAAYDLGPQQLLGLADMVPGQWLEVVIHQHVPMFYSAHCLFCEALSPGVDHAQCGRPCQRHRLRLQDRMGVQHIVQADADCHNTLFHGQPQIVEAEVRNELLRRGVRHFRVELLEEVSPAEISCLISRYCDLLGVHGRSW